MQVAVVQSVTDRDFMTNLTTLLAQYRQAEADLVLAPEVCLTGFCYDRMPEAAAFAKAALERLCLEVGEKALALTMIEAGDGGYYNVGRVIHKGSVIHTQAKYKLFPLGNEHRHFLPGTAEGIVPFSFKGVQVGMLICFELRFPELWARLKGCALLLVPAMWGGPRRGHIVTLSEALAIINRTFVAVADSADAEMAGASGFITPWGEALRQEGPGVVTGEVDPRQIALLDRAIPLSP